MKKIIQKTPGKKIRWRLLMNEYEYMKKPAELQHQAEEKADKILQSVARTILKTQSKIEEVVAGMGVWSFTDKNDIVLDQNDIRLISFAKAAQEYDYLFGPTYGPWRFKAFTKTKTNW